MVALSERRIDSDSEPEGRPRRTSGVALAAIGAEVAAFTVLLGASGSPGWRVMRVAVAVLVGASALLVEQRAGPKGRGVNALLLGVVGFAAGGGIGVMHLVKSDLDFAAFVGLVILGCGLTLFILGAVRMWRATHRWWRLGAIPLAFVVVQFAILPLTVAVTGTNLPDTSLGSRTPADRGLAFESVTLTTSDHVRLSAWYVTSRNGAGVVLLHGSGSTRTSVLNQAVVLARHGYGVLMPDARGHGGSGGVGMDFGWWGDRDIAAAVTWLAARPDVVGGRIAALGMSMGGEEAIGAAAGDPRIRAVITEGALWRGSMDTAWLPTDPVGYVDRATLAIQTAATSLLTSAPEPTSLHRAVARIAPRPVLLIAGQPELRGDRYLRDASPATVELWELPDTPHVSGLSRHPAEWEARVIGFLDRALQPRAGP